MSAFRVLLSSWRARGGAALVVLAALACWSNPLTDHLGYPAALVAALLATPLAAFVAADLPRLLRQRGLRASGGEAAAASALYGGILVALFALLSALHGVFADACVPGKGGLYFLLVALPGALLAPLLGLLVGARVRRRWLAGALALAIVPASIVWSLVRFYATPAIFAYDPFFGFFPGAIYDESVPLGATLVTYRLGTLGAIAATAGALAWLWDPERAFLSLSRARSLPAAALGCLAGVSLALGIYLAGPALGHRYDASDVARALGGRVEGPRCTVIYARAIGGREARRISDDCEVRLAQIEDFFGVRLRRRLTVFLFADAEQKQALMGAADTYIAKPWRYEVYLQHAPFPHPVLKHEIAHVVAGEMAPNPFHVSARLGLLPLPGLIEGAAVAAAWEGEGDTTPHQWSHAMLEAGLLPGLNGLAGLGFMMHASGTAYTAAGSFSRWLIEHYGAARYRDLYRDGDFRRAYGRDLGALERDWRAFLRTVQVPERVLARARARFRRASLIARVCPFETAEIFERAATRLAAGEVRSARDELITVVRNDPTELGARVALAEAWARLGRLDRAGSLVEDASRDLGPAAAARLRARIADVVWRWRGAEAARALYAGVDPDLFDEDEARTVEVKRWALGLAGASPDRAYTEALQDMLIGRGDQDPDGAAALARLLMHSRQGPRDGQLAPMAAYLAARVLEAHGRSAEAAALLDDVDPAGLISERVRAEAQRLLAVSLYGAGERARALSLFESLAAASDRPLALRETARDWADRIRREMR